MIYFAGSFPPFLLLQLLQYLESSNVICGGNFPTVGDLSRIVANATPFSNLYVKWRSWNIKHPNIYGQEIVPRISYNLSSMLLYSLSGP